MRTNLIWNPFVEVAVTGETHPHGVNVTVIQLEFRGETGERVTLCYEVDKFADALRDLTLNAEFGARIADAILNPGSDPDVNTLSDEDGEFDPPDDITGLFPE